jgi:hypothetical protein
MKAIIPVKLIIDLNTDGTFKDGVLQYQIDEDGSMDKRRFYTVGIKNGMDINKFIDILIDTQTIALNTEKIDIETSPAIIALQAQQAQVIKPIEEKIL